MKNMFDIMLETQKELQKRFNIDFDKMTDTERAIYIKEHSFWATDEIHEMIREVPFIKSWSKKYNSWDKEKMDAQKLKTKEEFIDVITFLMNVANALDFTGKEIMDMYLEKNKLNHERQNTNY